MDPEEPQPVWRPCFICGERFDAIKDPNHLEECRHASKP